jgi:hypothetical protein
MITDDDDDDDDGGGHDVDKNDSNHGGKVNRNMQKRSL